MSNIIYTDIDKKKGVFHLGSFVFGPFFLIFNGKIPEGITWLIGFPVLFFGLGLFIDVTVLSIFTYLLVNLYYTTCGNEILWKHKKCSTIEDFNKVNKIWNILSLVVFSLYVLLIINLF